MKIIKNKDHVLIKTNKGEYHFSHEEFNSLGEAEAKKKAIQEINKKLKSEYLGSEIDFKRAEDLGFCEYGIKDFCKIQSIDIDKTYKVSDLKRDLKVESFLNYPDECRKLFGANIIDECFGGIVSFLENNKTEEVFNYIIDSNYLTDRDKHLLACDFAYDCLPIFEKEYPNDNRPRKAIEAKLFWLDGKITDGELDEAWESAWGSVWESAWESARASAWRSAWESAWASAWTSSKKEKYEQFCDMILERLRIKDEDN